MWLSSNDYALSGSYRAKYFNIDGQTKVWVPCVSSIKTEITIENIDKYKYVLPDAIWLSTDISDTTSEIGSCWVVFENSNINHPIITAFLGDSVKQATSDGSTPEPDKPDTPDNTPDHNEENNPTPPSTGEYIWPVPSCTSISFNYHERYSSGGLHYGVDIGCATGTKVVATAGGTVYRSQWDSNSGYGYYVVIDHGNDLYSIYAHNSKLFVNAGDTVTQGQHIANSGATSATHKNMGAHLHFEFRVSPYGTYPGSVRSPWDYVDKP